MTVANSIDAIVEYATWLLGLASTNQLASMLAGTAILATCAWVWTWHRNRRDTNKIRRFLKNSDLDTEYEFRSTEAISAATKLPEARVAELCIRDTKIFRNTKEKQSWRLTAKS
jgi:hypothetical protein